MCVLAMSGSVRGSDAGCGLAFRARTEGEITFVFTQEMAGEESLGFLSLQAHVLLDTHN